MMKYYSPFKPAPLVYFLSCIFSISLVSAQPEIQAWSNFRGIRVEGQLMQFESSLSVIGEDWTKERATAKERNWTRYRREGEVQIVQTRMDSLFFTQKVSDTGLGKAKVEIEFDPHEDLAFTGAFFHLNLPLDDFSD
ncbi:MAG: hypothetical protein KDD99_18540, partial [Bacteroidetes bacterium]|nr:hypothetical protein [Bacteroidota bacterium]